MPDGMHKSAEGCETNPTYIATKAKHLEGSETTPKSCLDVVFELLATTACSSSNSLLESVRQVSTSSRKTSIKCAVTGSRMTEEVPAEFRCIFSSAIASDGVFKRQTRES